MPWWQIATLILVGTGAASWLFLLRAKLAAQLRTLPVVIPSTPIPPSLEKLAADLTAIRMEWAQYLEAFDDLHETVERKRRRATAAASKVEAAGDQAPQPTTIAEYRARARAMGLPV